MALVIISDLTDPNDPAGRTYRQINAAEKHRIPIGALVETCPCDDDGEPDEDDDYGVRGFVVFRGRNCDMTPLYWICLDRRPQFKQRWSGGFPEESLKVIKPPSDFEPFISPNSE